MKWLKTYTKLFSIGGLSVGFVVLLFLLSEHQVHRNNAFTRRYPSHPIHKEYDLDITYNSYYIAGFDHNILYLGNTTAPLHLLRVDLNTKNTVHIRVKLSKTDLPFRAVNVQVRPPYFFVMDGTVPCIFRGSIADWTADVWMEDKAYFSKAIVLDSNNLYIKTIHGKTKMTSLGLLHKGETVMVDLQPDILQKQIDGIFDVDGLLLATPDRQHLGYVYFYRNQFMVMDAELGSLERHLTIDTVQKAQIQLAQLSGSKTMKMKTPPLVVNKMAAMYKDFIFIGSDRLGRNEDRDMLNTASIIDVYNWKKDTYRFSFYLYHIGNKKADEFQAHDDYLVALIDNMLSVYTIREGMFTSSFSDLLGQKKITTGQ